MTNIETKYMGITLKSPFIAGSCGLTISPEKVVEMEKAGIGAVVIKSIFEEQITIEAQEMMGDSNAYIDSSDYFMHYAKEYSLGRFVETIQKLKASVSIPIIASVNCHGKSEWVEFAKKLESAGADALELNIFHMPISIESKSLDIEKYYCDIVHKITSELKIPVSVKIGNYFSNIPGMVNQLRINGAKSVVLFNRFYSPDIDLETLKIIPAEALSHESDYGTSLRWTAIVTSLVKGIDVSTSTGVHHPKDAVKMILAGANAVQLCSTLYKNEISYIAEFVKGLEDFMNSKSYEKIADFKGSLNYANIEDHEEFERVQFLKSRSSVK